MMNELKTQWESQVETIAVTFTYPPTPDVTQAVRQALTARAGGAAQRRMRLAWAMLLLLLLAAALLAVPQVRAAILRIFHIGAITVFETEDVAELPTPATPAPAQELAVTATAARGGAPVPASSIPSPAPLAFADFATAVTLSQAQRLSPAPLYLPAYPPDLGLPDQVYVQDAAQTRATILIWQDAADPTRTRLALYEIWVDQFAYKGATTVEETTINGRRAVWVQGPHFIQLQDGRVQPWQFVPGNVLIWWAENGVTFRLEGAHSLAEAARVAESLVQLEE